MVDGILVDESKLYFRTGSKGCTKTPISVMARNLDEAQTH